MLVITGKDVATVISIFIAMEMVYFIVIILIAKASENKERKPKKK